MAPDLARAYATSALGVTRAKRGVTTDLAVWMRSGSRVEDDRWVQRRLWSRALATGLILAPAACVAGLTYSVQTVTVEAGSSRLTCGPAISVATQGVDESARIVNPFAGHGDLEHLRALCLEEAKSRAWLGGGIAVNGAVLLPVLLAARRRHEQGPLWQRLAR